MCQKRFRQCVCSLTLLSPLFFNVIPPHWMLRSQNVKLLLWFFDSLISLSEGTQRTKHQAGSIHRLCGGQQFMSSWHFCQRWNLSTWANCSGEVGGVTVPSTCWGAGGWRIFCISKNSKLGCETYVGYIRERGKYRNTKLHREHFKVVSWSVHFFFKKSSTACEMYTFNRVPYVQRRCEFAIETKMDEEKKKAGGFTGSLLVVWQTLRRKGIVFFFFT